MQNSTFFLNIYRTASGRISGTVHATKATAEKEQDDIGPNFIAQVPLFHKLARTKQSMASFATLVINEVSTYQKLVK